MRFDVLRDRVPNRFWLLLDRRGNEVCVTSPGFPDDGVVTTDTACLVRWYAGELSLAVAQLDGVVTVSAPPWLERELARWGRLSPYAGTPSVTRS